MKISEEFAKRVYDTISVSPDGVLLSEVRADIGCTTEVIHAVVNVLVAEGRVRSESSSAGAITVRTVPARLTKKPMSGIVKLDYKIKYDIIGTGDVNDMLAKNLREYLYIEDKVDAERLQTLCSENGIDRGRFQGFNLGHVRMCVGNMLRGRMRRGEQVIVGGKAI